jgi:hypothetical protein
MVAQLKSRRCWGARKNRKTRRNQDGGAYQFTGASIGSVNNFAQETVGSHSLTPDCVSAAKSDTLGYTGPAGLPGLQNGGRYGFDLSQPLGGGTPFSSGIPQVVSIPCEASTTRQEGGGEEVYYAPTAGYESKASGWVGSTGAPVMIQQPYDAGAMNPACLKTGGARTKRRGTKRRGSKRRGSKRRGTKRN